MKASEIKEALLGETCWRFLVSKYGMERARLLSRKDGTVTSGDIGLLFDVTDMEVSGQQLVGLFQAALDTEIEPHDVFFLSNVVELCGFDFDKDTTENALRLVSSPDFRGLQDVRDAMQMLCLT